MAGLIIKGELWGNVIGVVGSEYNKQGWGQLGLYFHSLLDAPYHKVTDVPVLQGEEHLSCECLMT